MPEDRVQFKLNLPENVKAWLACEAARNLRSQSAEVIIALQEKMARRSESGAVASHEPIQKSSPMSELVEAEKCRRP